jgi:hypothetical protein
MIRIHFDRGWKPLPHIHYRTVGAASSRDKMKKFPFAKKNKNNYQFRVRRKIKSEKLEKEMKKFSRVSASAF